MTPELWWLLEQYREAEPKNVVVVEGLDDMRALQREGRRPRANPARVKAYRGNVKDHKTGIPAAKA